jgi:hypothetical protein
MSVVMVVVLRAQLQLALRARPIQAAEEALELTQTPQDMQVVMVGQEL